MSESINNRFKSLRENCGKSQEEFGKAIGISKSGVSDIETGRRNVTEKHIKLLIIEFNVNEAWLRYGEGEMFGILSGDEQYAMSVGRILAEEHPMARKVFSELAQWNDAQWDFVEGLIEKLHKKNE